MFKRLVSFLLIYLVSLDQISQVCIRFIPYVFFNKWKPSPNWTVSGFFGALASKGNSFGIYCSEAIDSVLGKGHCAKAAAHDEAIAPTGTP